MSRSQRPAESRYRMRSEHRQIMQIHQRAKAPADYVDDCGHPQHADLHPKATATSSCDAFEPTPTF